MTGQPIEPPPGLGTPAPKAADGPRSGGAAAHGPAGGAAAGGAHDWDRVREEPPTDADLYGLCPDPFAGPPEGADGWLADLSVPELEALAEPSGA